MVPILSLWLPILLSAVVVFVVSAMIHMFLTYHANDFRKLPDENGVADALRKFNISAGTYNLPHAGTSKEMKSAEFQEKFKKGPNVMMTILPPGQMSMTSSLIQWFFYCVVVGIFAAYVAGRALPVGAPYLSVFRFAGVTAFTSYVLADYTQSIWFKRAWSTTIKNTFDGLVYALLTAGIFGWLWPR